MNARYEIVDKSTGEVMSISSDILKMLTHREKVNEKSEKNKDFFQINSENAIAVLAPFSLKNGRAFSVFLIFCAFANHANGIVISQKRISEMLGISESEVSRAVSALIKNNLIKKHKVDGGSVIFALNDALIWKGKLNGKKYSLFQSANVFISDSQPNRVTKSINFALSGERNA